MLNFSSRKINMKQQNTTFDERWTLMALDALLVGYSTGDICIYG